MKIPETDRPSPGAALKGVQCRVLRPAPSPYDEFPSKPGMLTNRVAFVVLCGPGIPELHEADERSPALLLVKFVTEYGDWLGAIPAEPPGAEFIRGGNYIVPWQINDPGPIKDQLIAVLDNYCDPNRVSWVDDRID